MNFSDSIKSGLAQYASFRGRASRSEFWFFTLFTMLCYIVASIIDNALGTTFKIPDPVSGGMRSLGYGYAYLLVGLGLFLPGLSVMVRRLHDKDRSGWWYWIVLVPLIGAILILVWFCTRGTEGANRFGSDPLGADLVGTFR